MEEARRVFLNKKMIWVIMILLLMQSAVLLYSGNGNICENGTVKDFVSEYREQYLLLKDILNTKGEEEAVQWINRQKEIINSEKVAEYAYIRSIFILEEQLNAIIEYPKYLDYVQENAEKMQRTSLNTSSYLLKEIRKTQEDYLKMKDRKIELGEELAFRELLLEKGFSYSLLVIPVMICSLFLEERKKGLWKLLYSTSEYRKKYGCVRCLILLCGTGALVFLLSIWRVFLCGKIYGGYGNLARSIQSVSLCKELVIRISVEEFLKIWIAWNVIGICCLGMVIWEIFILFESMYWSVGLLTSMCIIERFLYTAFLDYSKWRILRYLNIYTLVEPRQTMLHYLNVNCLGKPLLITNVILIWSSMLIVLMTTLGIITQNRKMPVQTKYSRVAENNLLNKISRIIAKQNLFFQEMHKLLITQRGLIIIVVLIIIQVNFIPSAPVLRSNEDALREYFYREYSGEVTNEKICEMKKVLAQLQATVSDATESVQLIDELTKKKIMVLNSIIDECEKKEEIGEKVWLFPQNFYNAIINNGNLENHTRLLLVECMFFLGLLLPTVFSVENENNMRKLTASYYYGKGRKNKLRFYKYIWIGIYEFLVFSIIYGREFFCAYELYGRPEYLYVGAENLRCLNVELGQITIKNLLILIYLSKLILIVAYGGIMSFIGAVCNNVRLAQIFTLTLLVLPGALYLLGIEIEPFSTIWKWIGICELL